jgi:uncharacterized protein
MDSLVTLGTWTLTSCLMSAGVVGSALPFIPGPLLIVIGAVAHLLLLPQGGVSWWCVGFLLVSTVVAYALDMASGVLGARWFGASRWGVAGVVVGSIIGLFFGPAGWVLGPLLGGLSFEMICARRDWRASVKGTWGTVVGTGVGLAMRLAIAVLMVAAFLADVFWWN